MSDSSHVVGVVFHQPYLHGFYIKSLFTLVCVVFVHNNSMCRNEEEFLTHGNEGGDKV